MKASNIRKATTEAEFEMLGLPVTPGLPILFDEKDVVVRTAEEVATRASVLFAVSYVGLGGDRMEARQFLETKSLLEHLTPDEKALFVEEEPSEQALIQAGWRVEALWVLLWALRKHDKLDLPTTKCDSENIGDYMPRKSDGAPTLRPTIDLLHELDRIYNIHWIVRNAGIKEKAIPGNLDADVIEERHYALNWLALDGDDWDDVTTDT